MINLNKITIAVATTIDRLRKPRDNNIQPSCKSFRPITAENFKAIHGEREDNNVITTTEGTDIKEQNKSKEI